jgi:hypothetical protein
MLRLLFIQKPSNTGKYKIIVPVGEKVGDEIYQATDSYIKSEQSEHHQE